MQSVNISGNAQFQSKTWSKTIEPPPLFQCHAIDEFQKAFLKLDKPAQKKINRIIQETLFLEPSVANVVNETVSVKEPKILHKTLDLKHPRGLIKCSNYQAFLRVKGWQSEYRCVNQILAHLMRKCKSEGSRRLYLWHLYKFCEFTGRKPNELVTLKTHQAEKLAQQYADSFSSKSPRYSNLAIAVLKAFFVANGFKHAKTLELRTSCTTTL